MQSRHDAARDLGTIKLRDQFSKQAPPLLKDCLDPQIILGRDTNFNVCTLLALQGVSIHRSVVQSEMT